MPETSPSGGTTTATSVTTWLMRLVRGRTVATGPCCLDVSLYLSTHGDALASVRSVRRTRRIDGWHGRLDEDRGDRQRASPGSARPRCCARARGRASFERDERAGGHANTVAHDGLALDTGFLVHNDAQLPAARAALRRARRRDAGVGDVVLGQLRELRPRVLGPQPARAAAERVEPALPRAAREIGRWLRTARRSLDERDYEQHVARPLPRRATATRTRFRRHFLVPLTVRALVDGARAARSSSRPPTRSASSTTTACSASRRFRWRTVTGGSRTYVERCSTRLGAAAATRPRRRARCGATPTASSCDRRRRAAPLRRASSSPRTPTRRWRCSRTLRARTSAPARRLRLHAERDRAAHRRALPAARARRPRVVELPRSAATARPTVTYYLNRLQRSTRRDRLLRDAERGEIADEHVIGRFAYDAPALHGRDARAPQPELPALSGARRHRLRRRATTATASTRTGSPRACAPRRRSGSRW